MKVGNLGEIEAVAFDIDGTLYAQWQIHFRAIFHYITRPFFFLKYGLVRKEMHGLKPLENFVEVQAEKMAEKLLLNTSLDEFIEALRTGLGLSLLEEEEPHTDCSPQKHYIYGLKGLAQLLGCSLSTANRIKKSGVLNAAIVQNGKIIVIDADLALDLLRTHNKRNKYNK